ncbi:MAG: LPS-assembly protein LptD, partial [Candidatus Rokuibacteriota bacterium]
YILSEAHRGDLAGFYIRETELADDDRGWWSLRHEWWIAPQLSFKADVNGVSDDDVFREYTDRLHARSLQRAESSVFVTRTWEQWNLTANMFWYQDLTASRPVELYRLPDIRWQGLPQPMPGVPGLLYEVEASAVNFVRDVGSEGMRLDLHPRLSRPISGAGVTVTPFVGGRLTGYDKTVTGTRLTRAGALTVEETGDEVRLRRLVEAGTDVESRATRVYAMGGFWNMDAVLHSVEPRVNYTFITGQDLDRLPQWSEDVDGIPKTSLVTYALTNRVHARTLAAAGAEPLRWEFVRFTVAHSYNLRDEARPFGDLTGDLIVNPGRIFAFRADAAWDVHDDGLQRATTDLSVNVPRVTATVGTRFERQVSDFLQGSLETEVTRNLVARVSTNWDLQTDTFVENRLAVDLRFQCWAFTVEYVARHQDENAIYFTVNLLGVGAPLTTSAGLGGAGTSRGTVGGTGSPR